MRFKYRAHRFYWRIRSSIKSLKRSIRLRDKKKRFKLIIRTPAKYNDEETFPLYAIDLTIFGVRLHTKESIPRWLCDQNHKETDGRCIGYHYGGDGDPLGCCAECEQYAYSEEQS